MVPPKLAVRDVIFFSLPDCGVRPLLEPKKALIMLDDYIIIICVFSIHINYKRCKHNMFLLETVTAILPGKINLDNIPHIALESQGF